MTLNALYSTSSVSNIERVVRKDCSLIFFYVK
nr:MAG TPA: hypothetical protein [Caudoviricetes sp.]